MTLHLARIPVDQRALARFAAARGLADDDAGYALHAALLARFGAAAPRPFRHLPDARAGSQLLGYVADAAGLAEASALPPADPLLDGLFPAQPAVRAMPDGWRTDARYAFEVRVRPVVRFGRRVRAERATRSGAWQAGASEIDAYVAACEAAVRAGGDTATIGRETVYADWLRARLAGVATLEAASLRAFQRTRARRGTHAATGARTRMVEGPDAVIAGTLAIADPPAFAALLAKGVGRHAAFGFGMLLLSPPPGRGG